MNARALIELVRLVISKTFVKALFWLAVLIFISSLLPWTKGIYDRVFPRPELRIIQYHPSQDSQLGNEWWYQRIAVVENRGNSTANQVYVSASVPGGRITRYQVFADHPYTVHPNTDTSRGYLILALDSLAPGARIVVYLWGSQVTYSSGGEISFAAVHDTGSAPSSTELSSVEQIQDIVDNVLSSLGESFAFVLSNQRIYELASGLKVRDFYVLIPYVPPFLAISAIVLAFLAWLFFDPVKAALIHGGLVSGIFWLLVQNFSVPPEIMMLSTVPFFAFFALREGLFSSLTRIIPLFVTKQEEVLFDFDVKSQWMFSLSVLFLLFGFLLWRGIWPESSIWLEIRLETGCITVGYLATMLSLAFL
jgi:hypothetical protein